MLKNSNHTSFRHALQSRVLDKAMALFKEKGIKAVKMDDIASALSMSKRTLYELYDNKEQLLLEGIMRDNILNHEAVEDFARSASNEMEIVIYVIRKKMQELGTVNPAFFTDLNKYPRVLSYLQQSNESARTRTMLFMRGGVEHGFFLPQLNYDIVYMLGDGVLNYVVENKLYERYPLRDLFINYVFVQIRGICTEKGRKMIDEMFSDE